MKTSNPINQNCNLNYLITISTMKLHQVFVIYIKVLNSNNIERIILLFEIAIWVYASKYTIRCTTTKMATTIKLFDNKAANWFGL